MARPRISYGRKTYELSEAERRLPSWALEVMAACARGAHATELVKKLEAVLNDRLFEVESGDAWYSRFTQFQRAKPRELSPPESWTPVPLTTVRDIFAKGGDLAQAFESYERRDGQAAMADMVARALNNRTFLLAEAGTGVGKSLAYLVPCALWACQNNLPIVISTNTRNLQTQLLQKDVPLVRRIVANHLPPGVTLDAVALKGRGNYLCLKRFGAFVEGGFEALTDREALIFADLTAWAATTTDGDLDSFRPHHSRGDNAFVHSFGCHADTCTGKSCRFHRRCFLQHARQAALQAHLIIANHALVFAELTNPGALLPPHAQIVFDEAHNLENAATTFLSGELSPIGLYDLCQRLAPSKGREAGSLLQQVQRDFVDRAVQDESERIELIALLADIRTAGASLAKAGTALFDLLYGFLEETPAQAVRYRMAPTPALVSEETADFGGVDPEGRTDLPTAAVRETGATPPMRREVCFGRGPFRPAEEFVPEAEIVARRDEINRILAEANRLLERLLMAIARKTPPAGQDNPYDDVTVAIEAVAEGLAEYGKLLESILAGSEPNRVYWMQRVGAKGREVSLTAAPLDIAAPLQRLLYETKETLIFSSATLRIHNEFGHLRKRLGLNLVEPRERVREFVAQSPFDYPRQCCVAVADYLPSVEAKSEYVTELSRLMYQLFIKANGRSLALFTSYEMLNACAELLRPHLRDKGIDLLVQSSALGRDAITERFRRQIRPSVLFGTQSFWEGVDVVGEALSCVVIARLPFENAGDPLFQARSEKIDREGRSSFTELALPQAVIRFRQGFGRLIRSRSDRGMVVVADGRLLRASYGYLFAKSLPVKIEPYRSRPELVARLGALLNS